MPYRIALLHNLIHVNFKGLQFQNNNIILSHITKHLNFNVIVFQITHYSLESLTIECLVIIVLFCGTEHLKSTSVVVSHTVKANNNDVMVTISGDITDTHLIARP